MTALLVVTAVVWVGVCRAGIAGVLRHGTNKKSNQPEYP
jgi:hypothetical protein